MPDDLLRRPNVAKPAQGGYKLGPPDPLGDYRRGMASPEPGEVTSKRPSTSKLAMDPHMENRLGQLSGPGGGYGPSPGEVPPLGGPEPYSRMEKLALEHGSTPAFEPPPGPMRPAAPPPRGIPPITDNPAIAHQLLHDTMSLPGAPVAPPPSMGQRLGAMPGRAWNALPAPVRSGVKTGVRVGGSAATLLDTVNANSADLGHTIASGMAGEWLPGPDGQPYQAPDPSFMGMHFGGLADAIGQTMQGYDPFVGPPHTDTGPILRGPYQPSTSPPANVPAPGNLLDLFNAGRPGYNKYPGQPDDAEKVPASPNQRLTIPGLPRFGR